MVDVGGIEGFKDVSGIKEFKKGFAYACCCKSSC
jgi:hypothetical protein